MHPTKPPHPPFCVDHVGSLVRPRALLDAFDAYEDGTLPQEDFKAVADAHILASHFIFIMQRCIGNGDTTH